MNIIDRLWEWITSVKLTLFLLAGIGLLLILGTYVESTQGSKAAIAIIYRSPFMDGMIALLGINQITCTIKRYPYSPHQAGWLLTHVGVLIILVGSIYGRRGTIEGTVVIPEGGSTSQFIVEFGTGDNAEKYSVPLGFELALDKFDIAYYPGSSMAREYTSRVRLVDEAQNVELTQDIRVNYPLTYKGYVIAQQSYFEDGEVFTVLSLLKNPGTPIVFAGFIVLAAGIAIVVFLKPYLLKRYPKVPKKVAIAI